MAISLTSRFEGALIGLAVGDALGGHFEGQTPDWIAKRYPDAVSLIAHPPEAPWSYTDDTQMAIGVAEALLKDGEIIQASLCDAFVSNYLPSRGYGHGARVVLEAMEEGQDYQYWANELFPGGSYGNGAAMRVAPVGLLFHTDANLCREQARLSSLPTHVHPLGTEGAQLIALSVAICVREGQFKAESFFAELLQSCETPEFTDRIRVASQATTVDDLLPLGNGIAALDSVATAIGCFALSPDDFGMVLANAILLGGDTDTIAAMAGGISGALVGMEGIPPHFRQCLEDRFKGRSYIEDLARQLSSAFLSR